MRIGMWANAKRNIQGLGLVGLVGLLAACASVPTTPSTGVDPVLAWDAVTTNCIGEPITGVRYNVYAVSGAGPVPSTPSPASEPCGVVQVPSGTPLTSSPLTATTYNAIVPDGQWTFAVAAVLPSGATGGLSNNLTVQVLNRAASPTLRIGAPPTP